MIQKIAASLALALALASFAAAAPKAPTGSAKLKATKVVRKGKPAAKKTGCCGASCCASGTASCCR